MTRILRFLMIAAVAWPIWQHAAAQEPINEQELQKLLRQEREAKGSVLSDNANVENKVIQSAQKSDLIVDQIDQRQNAPKSAGAKAPNAGSQIICDGTTTSFYFPVYGSYFDYGTSSQMIYPASYLESFLTEGDKITALTFHARGTHNGYNYTGNYLSQNLNNSTVTLRIGETDATTIASEEQMTANHNASTAVFSAKLSIGSNQNTLTFTFNKPYKWNGGNLIVDFVVGAAGNNSSYYARTGWYGVSSTNSSYCTYNAEYGATSNSSVQDRSFLPKMTVDYLALNLYDVSIDGNGDFGKVVVDQQGRTTLIVTNTGKKPFTPVVTLSGDQEFTIKTNGYGELAPDEKRYYLVTFAPTALQNYSATVTVTAEESEASAVNATATLTGIGSETKDQAVGQGSDEESLPVNLYYLETANHGQIIYQASDLKLTEGTVIKKITFHANGNLVDRNNGTSSSPVTLKIWETDQSTYSSTEFLTAPTAPTKYATTSGTNIYTNQETVTFVFNGDGFTYKGGNLVVDASCPANGGTYANQNLLWLGQVVSSNIGVLQYGSNATTSLKTFLPWITIDCVPAEIKGRDLVVTDPGNWKNFTYDWYENGDTGNEKHTSSLDSIATDPDQIIAMLKEVYTNKAIPGNYKRGFTETGADDHDNTVIYTGVGELERTSTSARYKDTFGWNIPADPNYPNDFTKGINTGYYNSSDDGYSWGTYTYWYMDPEAYKPNEEGVTLLLVEINDDFKGLSNLSFTATSGYPLLREYFSKIIKSVRIVKDAKRTGEGLESGTLFKIDCDKMNMFYLLAKGQLAWFPDVRKYYVFDCFRDPCYVYNSSTTADRYCDFGVETSYNPYFLLGHMFEQFSPAISNATVSKDDIYQDLINMQSFGVVHDCPNVPLVQNGHHFMMYGVNDEVADCQNVRDMMFFVPDYRMLGHVERGGDNANASLEPNDRSQDYFNYNPTIQPIMGLYVIRQKEITPTVAADEYYMLNLNWVTNLDDFLPSDKQEFELFEVVVDEATGKESYVPVYYMNANGEYTDAQGNVVDEANKVPIVLTMNPGKEKNYPNVYVKREDASKEVTYIIRGHDAANAQGKHFLSLQYSNKMSYIVPGTDPSELVLLKDATHYSRFDAERIHNAYSNKLEMNNNVDGMKQANLTNSSQMTISRVAQVPTGSTAGVSTDPVTIATVTFNKDDMTYTVQMAHQAANEEEFPECEDGSYAGYHANTGDNITDNGKGNCTWTGSYTVNDGIINLGKLTIFDNFVQAIPDDNSHPFGYIYNVTTNYPCVSNAVFLNAAECTTGDEDWYAYTWKGDVNSWIKGVDAGDGLLRFTPVKPGSNVLFARKNKNNASEIWNQTEDLTFGTKDTYTISGWDNGQDGKMGGYWENTNNATAHGNTFRIPIYKTSSQINGIFSKGDVDGDLAGIVGKIGNVDLPENVEFGVGVDHNSITEVLRYDTYRWPEGDARYTVQTADGDDEEDIAPSGQAMNQGEYYTITMNGDTNYETNGEVSVSSGSGTATFVDKYPGLGDDAGAYIYAPVVEAFTNRGDYNTYGGPLQSSASGRFDAQRDPGYNPMSSYYWEDGGKRYAYYTIQFSVDRTIKMVPDGYDIYKIRVWRKIDDKSLLKEEYANQSTAIAARMGDSNGTYMYEITYDEEDGQVMHNFKDGASLGSIEMKELTAPVTGANGTSSNIKYALGTFGAQKLRTNETEAADLAKVIEQLDLTYVVRLYFTRSANLTATKGAAEGADGKYYIVEQEIPVTLQGGIPTAVENLSAREVVGVKYYNVAGIESDKPFQGVNIVVTRYSDGSTTTTKILK